MRASDSSSLPHRHRAWALLAPCSHPNHASNKFPACRRDSHSPPVGTPCSRARQQSPLLLPIDTTRQSSYVTTSDKEPRVDTTPGKLFVFIYLLLFFWGFFYQTIQHQPRCRARVAMMIATAGLSGTTPLIAAPPGGRVAQNMAMSASHLVQPAAN